MEDDRTTWSRGRQWPPYGRLAFSGEWCSLWAGLRPAVSYEKAEQPTRLVDLTVTIRHPHASCGDREEAIRRVARHCPVHETMATLAQVQFEIVDRVSQAA